MFGLRRIENITRTAAAAAADVREAGASAARTADTLRLATGDAADVVKYLTTVATVTLLMVCAVLIVVVLDD